jgi:hypothetical protein
MADEVQVIGADQAAADLRHWVDQLPKDIAQTLTTYGHQLVETLYGRQPFVSGTLAGSAELLPPTVDTFFALALGREVVYAGWIEFGGSRGRPLVPEGRTVWPVALESESQFEHQVELGTGTSIEKYPWTQQSA